MHLKLHQVSFLTLLFAVTTLYGFMLQPLLTAILWAALIAILFHPLQVRLRPHFGSRRNLLAFTMLLFCIFMVILPLSALFAALAREAAIFYDRVHSGEIDLIGYMGNGHVPRSLEELLGKLGLSVEGLQQSLKDMVKQSSSFIAQQALVVGQNTAVFFFIFILMLYLTFFFFRDGEKLVKQVIRGLSLGEEREHMLVARISQVVGAVVRGGMMVATVQGTLGGIILWVLGVKMALLWGVTMVFASLIPAVGASLIWGPIAIYLLLNGMVWQGIVLILFGAFVIGLIDNLLRPILVGRGTGVPDYLVLVSTLGGVLLFGVNGFILGPLVIALFISLWEMFIREYNPG